MTYTGMYGNGAVTGMGLIRELLLLTQQVLILARPVSFGAGVGFTPLGVAGRRTGVSIRPTPEAGITDSAF